MKHISIGWDHLTIGTQLVQDTYDPYPEPVHPSIAFEIYPAWREVTLSVSIKWMYGWSGVEIRLVFLVVAFGKYKGRS